MIRNMDEVLGSNKKCSAISSEKRIVAPMQRNESIREIQRPVPNVRKDARHSFLETSSATYLEIALCRPAAVMEKERARTGPKSWYTPMPSSPNNRDKYIL